MHDQRILHDAPKAGASPYSNTQFLVLPTSKIVEQMKLKLLLALAASLVLSHWCHAQKPSWENTEVPDILYKKYVADSLFEEGSFRAAYSRYKGLYRKKLMTFSEYFSYATSADNIGKPLSSWSELKYMADNGYFLEPEGYPEKQYHKYLKRFFSNRMEWPGFTVHQTLQERDQFLRTPPLIGIVASQANSGVAGSMLAVIDNANWACVMKYVEVYGWPDYDIGIDDLFTVWQHAVREGLCTKSDFNTLMPSVLRSAYMGKVNISMYCYLYDLFLINVKHEPQRFGTVYLEDNITLSPSLPVEEMNKERRQIGFYETVQRSLDERKKYVER